MFILYHSDGTVNTARCAKSRLMIGAPAFAKSQKADIAVCILVLSFFSSEPLLHDAELADTVAVWQRILSPQRLCALYGKPCTNLF